MSRNWIIAGVAAVCFITGVALSRVIGPGVRVEKIMLTANTPALRLSPATPGPHPIALLAHGATGSKENLFRFGEARVCLRSALFFRRERPARSRARARRR